MAKKNSSKTAETSFWKRWAKKLADRVFWWNVLGMVMVIVIAVLGVNIWLSSYTHHGKTVTVPDVCKMSRKNAQSLVEMNGLHMVVNDTSYNRRLPADCILAQSPEADAVVKEGRIVYVTVNSDSSPSLVIPDIINNCSLREAEARLSAMGFKLLEAKRVRGERDWVVGLEARGQMLKAGDRVSIEMPLRIHAGIGTAETEMDGSADNGDDFSNADESEVILVQ